MDWQLLITALIVITAAVYVGRSAVRAFAGDCSTGCGKCSSPPPDDSPGRRIALPRA